MRECDLVMKGGTTSGVVYPKAIYEIGKSYRLRSIAGSSAGAIAATVAAAAEYRRQTSDTRKDETGFEMVSALSAELGRDLTRFLQPSKDLKPLFDALITYQKLLQDLPRPLTRKSYVRIVREIAPILKPYLKKPARNGGLIAAGGAAVGLLGAGFGIGALGVTLGIVVGVAQFIYSFISTVFRLLKENDFGMVPGTTQPEDGESQGQAISDWLADKIDTIAGRSGDLTNSDPLTIGDLKGKDGQPGIELAAMTTDLTSQRPYSLPFKMPELYYFDQAELEAVLPKRVVHYMVRTGESKKKEGPNGSLFPVPVGDLFPVVLAARMSLSFPILLQTVPLWREDVTNDTGSEKWIRCLFSDGGISSNLPVHFFDSWLPKRPTFAIALGGYDEERDAGERVDFEQGIFNRRALRPTQIKGVFGFLFSILNTAKDWQDRLQSEMPGMYERVVTVRLEAHQGGTNLAMPDDVIGELVSYGEEAGRKLVKEFDFDENRWRRALCLLPELERALPRLHETVEHHRAEPTDRTYMELAQRLESAYFPQDEEWRINALIPFLELLSDLGKKIGEAQDTEKLSIGNLPDSDASLRLVATPDLTDRQSLIG